MATITFFLLSWSSAVARGSDASTTFGRFEVVYVGQKLNPQGETTSEGIFQIGNDWYFSKEGSFTINQKEYQVKWPTIKSGERVVFDGDSTSSAKSLVHFEGKPPSLTTYHGSKEAPTDSLRASVVGDKVVLGQPSGQPIPLPISVMVVKPKIKLSVKTPGGKLRFGSNQVLLELLPKDALHDSIQVNISGRTATFAEGVYETTTELSFSKAPVVPEGFELESPGYSDGFRVFFDPAPADGKLRVDTPMKVKVEVDGYQTGEATVQLSDAVRAIYQSGILTPKQSRQSGNFEFTFPGSQNTEPPLKAQLEFSSILPKITTAVPTSLETMEPNSAQRFQVKLTDEQGTEQFLTNLDRSHLRVEIFDASPEESVTWQVEGNGDEQRLYLTVRSGRSKTLLVNVLYDSRVIGSIPISVQLVGFPGNIDGKFNIITPADAERLFGKGIAKNYLVIEARITNNIQGVSGENGRNGKSQTGRDILIYPSSIEVAAKFELQRSKSSAWESAEQSTGGYVSAIAGNAVQRQFSITMIRDPKAAIAALAETSPGSINDIFKALETDVDYQKKGNEFTEDAKKNLQRKVANALNLILDSLDHDEEIRKWAEGKSATTGGSSLRRRAMLQVALSSKGNVEIYGDTVFAWRPLSPESVKLDFEALARRQGRIETRNVINGFLAALAFGNSFSSPDVFDKIASRAQSFSTLIVPALEVAYPDMTEIHRQNLATRIMVGPERIGYLETLTRCIFISKDLLKTQFNDAHDVRIRQVVSDYFSADVAIVERTQRAGPGSGSGAGGN